MTTRTRFKPVRPKLEFKISWHNLFIATAVSFSLFAIFLKLIGEAGPIGLFFKISVVCLICWPVAYAFETISKPAERRKKHRLQ